MDYMPPQSGQPGQPGPYQTGPQGPYGPYQPDSSPYQPQQQYMPQQQGYGQQPANPYGAPPTPQIQLNISNVLQQSPYGVYVAVDQDKGRATTGLILGILGLTLWVIPCAGGISALICSVIGIVMSAMGRRSPTGATMATVGLVLSIIGVCMVPIIMIFTLGFF